MATLLLTGGCSASTDALSAPDPPWLDLDGTDDDPSAVSSRIVCGDIDAEPTIPLFPTLTLTVLCVDDDGNEACWTCPTAPAGGSLAQTISAPPLSTPIPGAPSKCRVRR